MGLNTQTKKILLLSCLSLALVACSQENENMMTVEKIESNTEQFKLFQPLAIEEMNDSNVVGLNNTMAMVSVEDTLIVGLVKDLYSQDNIELESSLIEALKVATTNCELITEIPETDAMTSYINAVNQLISKGAKVVIVQNERALEALEAIVTNYPDVTFVTLDCFIKSPNVFGIKFREESASYLAGVVAATQTKTNKIGFLTSNQENQVNELAYASFLAGAVQANPTIQIERKNISETGNPYGIRFAGEAMFKNNVDVIYEQLSDHKMDLIELAKEVRLNGFDVWVINSNANLFEQGKINAVDSVVLTTTQKHLQFASNQVVERIMEGDFKGGNQLILGLENDGVSLDLTNGMLSKEMIDLINEYKQKIINGEIMIPSTLDGILVNK